VLALDCKCNLFHCRPKHALKIHIEIHENHHMPSNEIFSTPHAPISWGELIDKITILEIKAFKITAPVANDNIKMELSYLSDIANSAILQDGVQSLKKDLTDVNLKLWDVEDDIRDKELAGEFDSVFIELARSVYKLNDTRAKIKKAINTVLKSELVEEKSYKDFESGSNQGSSK
jgi:hypothetical protein